MIVREICHLLGSLLFGVGVVALVCFIGFILGVRP